MEGTDRKMSMMKRTVMMLVCLLWLFGGISLSARTEKKAVAMWVDAQGNCYYSPGFQALIRT